jgi:hypothetical protein
MWGLIATAIVILIACMPWIIHFDYGKLNVLDALVKDGSYKPREDQYSRQRIVQLERESMEYWEQRFIAAGGTPEKKEVVIPEYVHSLSPFDQYLYAVNQETKEMYRSSLLGPSRVPPPGPPAYVPGGIGEHPKTRRDRSYDAGFHQAFRQVGSHRPLSPYPGLLTDWPD